MDEIAGVLLIVAAISGVSFLCGFAIRQLWLPLIPLVLGGLAVGSVALFPSDEGDLPHAGQVTFAIAFIGAPAVIAAVSLLAGAAFGRARARSS